MKYVRRPSPALIIACVALFISLGGVSYGLASGSIDSRELKNNTVRSKDVRNNTLRTFDIRNNEVRGFDIRNSTIRSRDVALNTLTGADISEKDLAKVPAATQADSATTATSATSATSAGNAATVGGMSVRKFFAKPAPGTAPSEVFRGQGFVLRAGCTAGNAAQLFADPVAGAPAASISGSTNDGPLTVNTALNTAEGSGTAVISTTSGVVETIVYGATNAPAFAGENVCSIRGTVTSG